MEPQLPKPQLPNVEQAPALPQEYLSGGLEKGILQETNESNLINPEQDIQTQSSSQSQQVQADDQTVAVLPQQPLQAQFDDQATQSGTPVIAADEDVIEKEWVDKAKRIVASNRDDPRMQKHEVSALQADYIQKRYGKTIKLPDES